MNMPEADFMSDFKRFLDKHVDCRLEAMLTEDHRTANHEDRTAELESRTDNLEEQGRDHEDRLDSQTNASTLLAEELREKIEELESRLESKVDDIESQATDHEDRIDMLDGFTEEFQAYEDRILALETKLSQLDDINNILERKIQQLLQMNRIKLYLASAAPTD